MRVTVVREEDDLGQFYFFLDYQKSDGQIISSFLELRLSASFRFSEGRFSAIKADF
jgi:hypothetical protein